MWGGLEHGFGSQATYGQILAPSFTTGETLDNLFVFQFPQL